MCIRDSAQCVCRIAQGLENGGGTLFHCSAGKDLSLIHILLLLLSLSSIVSGQAEKLKRMAQKMALLERRVRELEEQAQNGKKS